VEVFLWLTDLFLESRGSLPVVGGTVLVVCRSVPEDGETVPHIFHFCIILLHMMAFIHAYIHKGS
jgi:hypothetical protein